MTHYLILAEGGCYGNFLACLIRSMWDLNFTKGRQFSDPGACDFISEAIAISRLVHEVYQDKMYPENPSVADKIVQAIRTKEYTKTMGPYEMGYDPIDTFHYISKDSVDKFLTVDNVKIVYVTQEQDDYKLIALNKISKNFDDNSKLERVKKDYKELIEIFCKENLEEFEGLTDFKNMSNQLKQDLVSAWVKYMSWRTDCPMPDPTERILFVSIKDIINNKNKVLEDLAAFTVNKINETSVEFYKQYLEAQKKVWDYVKN